MFAQRPRGPVTSRSASSYESSCRRPTLLSLALSNPWPLQRHQEPIRHAMLLMMTLEPVPLVCPIIVSPSGRRVDPGIPPVPCATAVAIQPMLLSSPGRGPSAPGPMDGLYDGAETAPERYRRSDMCGFIGRMAPPRYLKVSGLSQEKPIHSEWFRNSFSATSWKLSVTVTGCI